MSFPRLGIVLAFATLVCGSLIGCGTSQYNELVTRRIGELKHQAPFTALTAPTEIPGTSVKIGIPKVLSRFLTLDTDDATSPTGKINPDRVKLRQLALNGVYCAYDAEMALDDGSKAPAACQIAIIPKTAPEAANVGPLVEGILKTAFAGQPVAWEAVEVDTVTGESRIPWKMIHVEGNLQFEVTPADGSAGPAMRALPAVVEVWWHESEPYHTFLVWRAPKEVNDKENLMDLARRSAGTISVGPPPEAPAAEQAAAN